LFLALLAVSVLLRLLRLDMSFWMDEIITVTEFVRKPWLKIITEVPYPNNHIFYTLLAKLSVSIFGEHEWSARLPAMVMGAFIPPVAFLVFRRKFPEFAAFAAGLFLALNFWSLWFSQDARGYSGMLLFGMLGTYFGLEYLERGGKRPALLFLLCQTLCVWFYLYGFFLVAGQMLRAIYVIARKKSSPAKFIPLFLAAFLGIALYLPGLKDLWHYSSAQTKMAAMHRLDLIFLKDTLMMLAGARLQIIGLVVVTLGLAGALRAARNWPGFFAVSLTAAALIILFTWLSGLFIYPRFLLLLMPAAAISVGSFLELPGRKWIQHSLLALMCILLLPGLFGYYRLGKEDFKNAAYHLKQLPAQKIICYGIICRELGYYYPAPMTEVAEKTALEPEFIRDTFIISRQVDWTAANLAIARERCRAEKTWPSAGYKENRLWLLRCD